MGTVISGILLLVAVLLVYWLTEDAALNRRR